MTLAPAVRRHAAPLAVAAILLLTYGLTLARDVTFWDAGEFIAAASTFGIPHPPGTPLYVMLLRVALLGLTSLGVPAAAATSVVSALCTVAACAAGAAIVARATGDSVGAAAGGVAAGTMASVWLNATETEVYAASLALSLAMVVAAERAGRLRSIRWAVLAGYLVALAVPLHLSALLAAPAALLLAAGGRDQDRRPALTRSAIVGVCVLAAFAIGTMRAGAAIVAAVALLATAVLASPMRRPRRVAAIGLAQLLVVGIAASGLLVLLLRARHDPAVNQGDPSTWAALVEVVARRQYAVADLWPRQAPLWLQLGNLLHYADWQVALSLGPTIFPTPLRTLATLAFAALAIAGARAHRARDRRTFGAVLLLLLAGTVGAALYLNLRAGPSYGHGVLPPASAREARERDYFFVLGWWAWGLWAGYGAVALARRFRMPAGIGVATAAVPLVLNWAAVDRTRLPDAVLPRATAEALLLPLPARAVLFVAGDNDSYPLWYAQRTLGLRPDVAVITTPLLPADWYREELAERHGLFAPGVTSRWRGRSAAIAEIAQRARADGRRVAMAVSMPAADRARAGSGWLMRGATYVAADGAAGVALDTLAAATWADRFAALTRGLAPRPSTDGTARYMHALLACPATALAHHRAGLAPATSDSLAPRCNFR